MIRTFSCIFVSVFLCFSVGSASAQVCTGSLGDPVANITFGSGGQGNVAAAPLASGVTDYIFSQNCPNDGQYQLSNRTLSCPTTWHVLDEDHTPGDRNGYMMVVNASRAPGIFYRQPVSGLCPNTTYEFAAWAMNLIRNFNLIRPNITFTIETSAGVQLATYDTGDIPEIVPATWKQYGVLFSTPAGVSDVVILMRNNAPGGNGNDLLIDDITFRPCGPVIDARAAVRASVTNSICEGQSGVVDVSSTVSSGFSSPTLQWQVNLNNGSGWQDIPGATSGTYAYAVSNARITGYKFRLAVSDGVNGIIASCRIYSKADSVIIIPEVTADAGPDKAVLKGSGVRLEGQPTGTSQTYRWTPQTYLDDPTSLTPLASPTETTTYTLTVTSADGCNSTDTDEMEVRVFDQVIVNNTFSPNADGTNDYWEIPGLNTYPGCRVRIFNRYGETMFSSVGYPKPWDGTTKGRPVPAGVYSYVIDKNNGEARLSGWVMVAR